MAINSKGEKGCESPMCLWVILVVIDFLWHFYYGLLPPFVGVFDIHCLLDYVVFI